MAELVYLLCALTSFACAALLIFRLTLKASPNSTNPMNSKSMIGKISANSISVTPCSDRLKRRAVP